MLSRNFCQKCVRENSRTLHNFQFQFSLKFREINLYCNADFTNIFTFGGKFRNFQMLLLLSHFAHLQSNSWNQFFVRFIIKSSDETLNSTTFTQLDLKCYKYVIDLYILCTSKMQSWLYISMLFGYCFALGSKHKEWCKTYIRTNVHKDYSQNYCTGMKLCHVNIKTIFILININFFIMFLTFLFSR